MSSYGWISIHRELLNKPIWQQSTPEQRVLLITILLMANHDENTWEWKGETYKVKPGQFITSLNSIEEKAGKGISVQNIRTALKRFEKLEFLTNESTKQGRLITIVNWELYQNERTKSTKGITDSQQTANKQLTSNNNDNKDNKDNKRSFGEFSNVKLSEIEHTKLINQYGDKVTKDFIEKVDAYVESTGKKYKSHYATILSWIRKEPNIKKTDYNLDSQKIITWSGAQHPRCYIIATVSS